MEFVSFDKQLLKSDSGNNKRLYSCWITSVIMRNVRINFMHKLYNVLI